MKKRDIITKAITTKAIGLILVLLAVGSLLKGQSIAGDWYGMAEIQGFYLRINLHLTETDKGLTGSFDSPDQGAMGIPLTTITLNDGEFAFSFAQAGLSYTGSVDPAFTRIRGEFKQGDLERQLDFRRTPVELPENSIPGIKAIYDKQEVYIKMRDGVKLFTSIYTPKNQEGASPILMNRTPYNIEGGGEQEYNMFLLIYYRFVKENYIFVFQDVRGRYMSEGKYENVRPFIPDKKGTQFDEASDTYDTAEWLVKNVQGNNGNIGVMGISYPGFYSTMAILANHPAIKAVSPQAPVTNWFIGDDWHHNGALMMLDGVSFYTNFGEKHPKPSRRNTAKGMDWGTEDNYEFFMRNPTVKGLKEKYFSDPKSYFTTILNHPDYDAYWKSTDPRPHLINVKPAVMTVGGWFDAEDCWGALHTYQAIEKQNPKNTDNRLVMGPWSHGQWATSTGENMGNIYWGMATNDHFHEIEVEFFNYYLKNDGEMTLPEATIFITGTNEWKNFETWPPKTAVGKTIFFQADDRLDFIKPATSEFFVEYVSDPMKPVPYTEDVRRNRTASYMTDDQRFASRRPDVMVYQTEVLKEDVTVVGPLMADLYVSTTGTDADFVVKLIDVYPDDAQPLPNQEIDMPLAGYQMLVRGEVFRGRYRNSFEKPEPFKPGEITQVSYELPDVAHTFRKGHRIMVQVQNSWFPLVDRNPQQFINIYQADAADFKKAVIRIYSDKNHPSGVKLLVIKN